MADKTWLVGYRRDNAPIYYHIYHRDTKSPQLLFSDRSQLEQLPLVSIKPISYHLEMLKKRIGDLDTQRE